MATEDKALEECVGLEEKVIKVDEPSSTPNDDTEKTPLSKNQIKKQKKRENFERTKKERRMKERQRQKQKRLEAQAQGQPTRTGPSRKELKRRQVVTNTGDQSTALRIAIDLDYDDVMNERDVAKCVKQCLRIYTINRRAKRPAKLHFTGIRNNGLIHNTFKKNDGWENWHIKFYMNLSHTEAFPASDLIYLTCESDNVLDRLDAGRIYVIGGLVDHNHQKGLSHSRATDAGIQTARLPLSEYIDMKTRAVLSTYHVFEILLGVAEGKSWTDAILETVPARKGAKPKKNSELTQSEVQKQQQLNAGDGSSN